MSVQSQRIKVLSAGVFSLILTMGIARFAYTPLLPIMQAQTDLNDVTGGWLAAINYMGYLSGALIAASVSNLQIKDTLYRLGIFVAIVTTAGMAITENFILWSIFRFFAGLTSAAGLLVGSGLVLNWLIRHNFRSELGIHFSGAGLGIAFGAAVVEVAHRYCNWSEQWWVLTLFACLLAIPALKWLPKPDSSQQTVSGQVMIDRPPTRTFLYMMMLAYFCAGYGYVISTTFIVDILEQQAELQGKGAIAFLVLGLSAAPACFIWDRIARTSGEMKALLYAYSLQIIGILIPALSTNLFVVMFSAILFGGTFIGIVSLVLTMAGRFYPTKPAKLMGKMTLSYGVAQIIGPAITGMLAGAMGNYDLGLWIAACMMLLGTIVIALLQTTQQTKQQTEVAS
ncbi:MAG: YbfB/YjiJ family MFS transporter [Neptuniibacter sp.]